MFIQQNSDSYQSHMDILHTYYSAIIYNEIPITCIRGQIICFPKLPSMPFFYIHNGTCTVGSNPLSVLYSPLQREVQAVCERDGLRRRDGLRVPFSSVLYVQYCWWAGEVCFNGHGVLNNLTFHRTAAEAIHHISQLRPSNRGTLFQVNT